MEVKNLLARKMILRFETGGEGSCRLRVLNVFLFVYLRIYKCLHNAGTPSPCPFP